VRDVLYLSLTVAAFAAFLGYVRFCAWMGGQDPDATTDERAR
jgi:hypothetical protein